MSRRGFTLIELLVAVGIIAVLAGLLIPIVREARKTAVAAQTTVHLRQVGVALAMYKSDNDGGFPLRRLDPLVDGGYIRDPAILLVPGDAYREGYGTMFARCLERRAVPTHRTSFEDVFVGLTPNRFLGALLLHDPNPGLVVSRVSAGRSPVMIDPNGCENVFLAYMGQPVIRLRADGSIERASMPYDPLRPGLGVTRWSLFSDVPEPEW